MKNLFGKQYENLATAYNKTIYRCLNPPMELKIGEGNPEVDHFLREDRHEMLCILTAYNPKSVIQSAADNQQSQDELVTEVEGMGFFWLKGVNQDPDIKFPDEPSCWILGMTPWEADKLAKRWEQNAFVFYGFGEQAELKWVIE